MRLKEEKKCHAIHCLEPRGIRKIGPYTLEKMPAR